MLSILLGLPVSSAEAARTVLQDEEPKRAVLEELIFFLGSWWGGARRRAQQWLAVLGLYTHEGRGYVVAKGL